MTYPRPPVLQHPLGVAFREQFERTTLSKRIRIVSDEGSFSTSKMHSKMRTVQQIDAEFVVEMDVPRIVASLMAKARNAKGKRAAVMSGLIVVRRRGEKVIASRTIEQPIPAGWKEEAS